MYLQYVMTQSSDPASMHTKQRTLSIILLIFGAPYAGLPTMNTWIRTTSYEEYTGTAHLPITYL